jgi:hypothetical protein
MNVSDTREIQRVFEVEGTFLGGVIEEHEVNDQVFIV